MKEIGSCPACGCDPAQSWPAVVAPFITELALESLPPIGRTMVCGTCHLRFTGMRLSDTEVSRLYSGYRGEAYFRCRHRHEPWYTLSSNCSRGGDPREIHQRQTELERLLKGAGIWPTIGSVLDYGGDRGQFIPAGLAAGKWVYEISGVQPIEGVLGVTDRSELQCKSFDFLMACHIFEHVMDPMGFLVELSQLLAPRGTIYIEVPLELPAILSIAPALTSRWYAWLVSHLRLLRIVDFVSTASRTQLGFLPPFGLLKSSEHVNFFDERSLGHLLQRAGFTCLRMEVAPALRLAGRIGVLRCLARKP